MRNNNYLYAASILFMATVFSCKKDSQDIVQENPAAQIIKIENTSSTDRIDLADEGLTLDFENYAAGSGNVVKGTDNTVAAFPYQLVFKGKINPKIGADNNALSALEVSDYGDYYAVAYQTPSDKFGGGVDVIDMKSGTPKLVTSVATPNADITCITNGGGRLYLGMDLKTYEKYDYPAPAVFGVVNIDGGSLNQPQVVGLEGFSTKDVKYNTANGKVYTASGTQGGVSIISFAGNKASRTAFQPYGGARSIAISYGQVIATNGYSYADFESNTAAETNYRHWPIRSNEINMGGVYALANGNFVYGNNYSLIYVDKTSGTLIDEVELNGWINSVSIVNEKMYISAGNSLVVAIIENNKIKVPAKTHFASVFGGKFNVISSKVAGNHVFVACGARGTYVFKLKES